MLPDAVYPVVFSPTPIPKSVAAESVPKPFIEASFVIRHHEHSEMQQIKLVLSSRPIPQTSFGLRYASPASL